MTDGKRFVSTRGALAGIALDGQVPTVLLEGERGFEVARLEGGALARHVAVPGTPTGSLVIVSGVVFLSSTTGQTVSLVSAQPGRGAAQTIAELSTPHLARTPRGELVFTQGDQLVLLSAQGPRALVELPGAEVEVDMEIDHRSRGVVQTRVRNPRSVVGRVEMTTSMATTDDAIVYATVGDTVDADAIRAVPRKGGLPQILFRIADREDPARGTVGARLGPIAASSGRLATIVAQSTTLGGRFGAELVALDGKSGAVLGRVPIASSVVSAIAMSGDRVVIARRVDEDEVIELWTLGATAWRHVTRRRGRGLAIEHDALWLGDGDALVRIDLGALSVGPSAKVAQLLELVRRAEGRYEKTSFQGKPAIKITAADGSRSIKPLSDAELEELEALLRA